MNDYLKKPKAILFDMGDTLILQKKSDFLKGTRHLMSFCHETKNITPEMVQKRASETTEELSFIQNKHHIDTSCMAFQKYLFESFGLYLPLTKEDQEIEFNRTAFDRELAKGLYDLLDVLKENNIRVAILSNTTFSENTLRDELSIYHLEHAFEFVMATSEYIFRKPDKRIFELALEKLNLSYDDVYYVGNSFKYDVMGANNSKIHPIWFNHEQKNKLSDIPFTEITDLIQLKTIIEGLI